MLKDFLETKKIQLPFEALTGLLDANENTFVFVKNYYSIYQYANPAFLHLFGLQEEEHIYDKRDSDLCRDKNKVKIYLQDDEHVFDSKRPVYAKEEVMPSHHPTLTKTLAGTLFPLMGENSGVLGVLGIFNLQDEPCFLTVEAAVSFSAYDMETLIQKRSYPILIDNRKVTLSRRELQCIIGLIQGMQARDISVLLSLQLKTVEFYFENIKNKLGASSKSSLIHIVFNQKILQQIIL